MNAVTQLRHGLFAACLGRHQLRLLLFQCGLLAGQLLQGLGNAQFQLLQLAQGFPVVGKQFVAGLEKIAVVSQGPRHRMGALLVQQHLDLALLAQLPGGFQFQGDTGLLGSAGLLQSATLLLQVGQLLATGGDGPLVVGHVTLQPAQFQLGLPQLLLQAVLAGTVRGYFSADAFYFALQLFQLAADFVFLRFCQDRGRRAAQQQCDKREPVQGAVLGHGCQPGIRARLAPVISGGCGRSIMASRVGAISASLPPAGSSCNGRLPM